jgi:hypothetical protein
MRVNTRKMRIKKVSSKAPQWQRNRQQEKSMKINITDSVFDVNGVEIREMNKHWKRKYG